MVVYGVKSNKKENRFSEKQQEKIKGNLDPIFRRLITNYRNTAKDRRLDFRLTDEECRKLFNAECFYCGSPPSNINRLPRDKYGRQFMYSGIDRIDNSKGYIDGNVRSCCKYCNTAKLDRTNIEFDDWIIRIYEKHIKGHNK